MLHVGGLCVICQLFVCSPILSSVALFCCLLFVCSPILSSVALFCCQLFVCSPILWNLVHAI